MTVTINGTTGITSVNGTAAAPSVTGTDTDTGIVYGTNTITLSTGGTAGLIQDASQNLGLGVTPSAWSSFRAIDFQYNGSIQAYSSGGFGLAYNAWFNGGSWIAKSTGSSCKFGLDSNGAFSWQQLASVTNNTGFTYNTAMTLTSGGALQLGTTQTTVSSNLLMVGTMVGSTAGVARIGSNDQNLDVLALTNWSGSTTNNGVRMSFDNSGRGGFTIGGSSGSNNFDICRTWGTPDVRIDSSGNLLVGVTTATQPDQNFAQFRNIGGPSGVNCMSIGHVSGTSSGVQYAYFVYGGGAIGSISQNGTTAVAYNTSSDYRLKHDIAPMTGALARVAALKPVTYKWNADNSDAEGFIAHELAEVCPHAVTGEKDAVDEDGNPKYQGIDTSFLVATLTAAIQEQQAIIEQLQADVAALKA